MRRRAATYFGAALLGAAAPAGSAPGDVLVLTDGRILRGEVVASGRDWVSFRCQMGGIWTTVTYDRKQYEQFEREPGDQSDAAATAPSPDRASRPAPAGGAPDRGRPRAPGGGGPVVAVVPLLGQVGGVVDRRIEGTFDAGLLEACLEEARERGAILVLLDIHSPGGLVGEMESICEKIVAWKDRLRIAAYARDAFSAAAIIALTCPEIVVRPDSRLGAAVIVHQGPGGMTAVEAKMASVHHARQRQFMEASGHPYEIVAAMTIQEAVLWWSPQEGFATAAPPAAHAGQWQEVDGRTTVLTMTARQALDWGIAEGSARTAREAAQALGITGEPEILALDQVARQYNSTFDRKFTDLQQSVEAYFDGLGGMVEGMNGLVDAARQGDRKAAGLMKAQVNRNRGKVLASARRIREADRSILARRVALHERIIERLELDTALLGRISGLLSTDQVDDFNEAAQRLNQVLEAWRELLQE